MKLRSLTHSLLYIDLEYRVAKKKYNFSLLSKISRFIFIFVKEWDFRLKSLALSQK